MNALRPTSRLLLALVLVGASASSASSATSTASTTQASTSASWPALTGLQPGVYLRKRNHDPDITADLRALPAARRVDVALALLAAPDGALPLAGDAAYPAGLDDKARARLRALEVRAARAGALAVLGDSDDPRALPALRRALTDADDDVAARAAERLGQHSDAPGVVDTLRRVAFDDGRAVSVRAGACAGLGRHRGRFADDALDALLAVAQGKDVAHEVVAAALRATANLGSSWAWQARGDVGRGAALRAKARAALFVPAPSDDTSDDAHDEAKDDAVAAARQDLWRRLR